MPIKIAILDLYDGHPNQGMRCFQDIILSYGDSNQTEIVYRIFDVRGANEIPDTDFDIYFCSGGPGSPVDSEGSEWENNFFGLIEKLQIINKDPLTTAKKFVFFVCHSFQLFCRKYQLGKVSERRSTSFGVFPIHKTEAAEFDMLFGELPEPFFAADSRDWQVTEPDYLKLEEMGAHILAIEKERPHVSLERCMMAVRFNDYFYGTQFHPEADPVGMKQHFLNEEKKQQVIDTHGIEKYTSMLTSLDDPQKLQYTQDKILPVFLNFAIKSGQEA